MIGAADARLGIGKDNDLPWKLPAELRYFKRTTRRTRDRDKRNAVIMGRLTWESTPQNFRPLKGRLNVVVTRKSAYSVPPGVELAHSLEQALARADRGDVERIFVIGGAQLYRLGINDPGCDTILLTRIQADFDCDTFFPQIPQDRFVCSERSEIQEENGVRYQFERWTCAAPPER